MALHKDFPQSPHAILDPGIRWFPADEALREKRAKIGDIHQLLERIAYASNPKRNPYPAQFERSNGVNWLGQINRIFLK
jgi:hypothetical protein